MSFDQTIKDIDAEILSLEGQANRLRQARALLSDEAPAEASSPPQRRPGRPAGSSTVNRSGEALSLVEGQPGIKIPALAEAMGIQANYLYRVMPKLAKEGKVTKDSEGGWHVKG